MVLSISGLLLLFALCLTGVLGAQIPFASSTFYHSLYPSYSLEVSSIQTALPGLRNAFVNENDSVCPGNSSQYVGYIHTPKKHHLFFWYFESESNPAEDPLVIWFTGGPGGSGELSLVGMLGPCKINEFGNGTIPNEYGWSKKANLIVIDQPVGVGFSYSDSDYVYDSDTAGKDIYAFFQLFYKRFPERLSNELIVSGGSYGPTYIAHSASYIYWQNKRLEENPTHDLVKIPLSSLILGNPLMDFSIASSSSYQYLCEANSGLIDNDDCRAMKEQAPISAQLFHQCYKYKTHQACDPAIFFYSAAFFGPLASRNINVYDITRKCDSENPVDCMLSTKPIDDYFNSIPVRKKLKVIPDDLVFKAYSEEVGIRFSQSLDPFVQAHSELLIPLIDSGIRTMVYVGEWDFITNYVGNFQVMSSLDTVYQSEFVAAEDTPLGFRGPDGEVKGVFRGVGEGSGNFTYVLVYKAGHGVAIYQRELMADLLDRWIKNVPLD